MSALSTHAGTAGTAVVGPGGTLVPPGRRSTELLVLAGAVGAVVGLVVGVLAGGVVGLVIGLVVGAGLAVGALWWRAGSVVETGGGTPADPRRDARLVNVVEGLAASAGIRVPALVVVDAPGLNLAVSGREAASATLTITTGALGQLTRIELEGLIATGVASIRRGETRPATLAAALGGRLAGRAVGGAERDRVLDAAAAAVTRYPPGLVAAYAKLDAVGTAVPTASTRGAHFWIADPAGGSAPVRHRLPIRQRIEALSEL